MMNELPERFEHPGGTWLVTGATGSLGPAVVDDLVATGASVRVLTRQADAPSDRWPWAPSNSVEIVTGDIADDFAVQHAMRGVDVVVHAAGIAHKRPRNQRDIADMVSQNVTGASVVARAADICGVERTVFLSSAAVYGPGVGERHDETAPTRPVSAYGRSKLESERAMGDILGSRLTTLRVSAVVGARLRGQHRLLARVVASPWPIPVVNGSGHNLICDVDLARLIRQLALAPHADGAVVNISNGHHYSVREIVDGLRAEVGAARWRTPIIPQSVGFAAARVLTMIGSAESTRLGRLRHVVGSIVHGPALDIDRLHQLLPAISEDPSTDPWKLMMSEPARLQRSLMNRLD